MLALGSIYERGLADESNQNILAFGSTLKKAAPENSSKAFEFYDKAAESEPYALYKLG